MASTQWASVALAATSLMRGTAGYRSPEAAGTGIPVFFGPEYGITADRASTWLSIAWSGDPDLPQPAGGVTQDPATLAAGTRPRDETGQIHCRACVQNGETGDAAFEAATLAAYQVVADVEALTRTNPTLGMAQPTMLWAFVTADAPILQFQGGPVAAVDFTLTYQARL
jgi:hypothetical protein